MLIPTTRSEGLIALAAIATPAASPPPESGTSNVSMSGRAAMISSPMVPCPAITARVVEGRKVRQPLLGDQPRGLGLGRVLAAPDDPHLRPERANAVHLGLRHKLGHADHRPDPPRRAA